MESKSENISQEAKRLDMDLSNIIDEISIIKRDISAKQPAEQFLQFKHTVEKYYATKDNIREINTQLKTFSSVKYSETLEGRLNSLSQKLSDSYYSKLSIDSKLRSWVDNLEEKLLEKDRYKADHKETELSIAKAVNHININKNYIEEIQTKLNLMENLRAKLEIKLNTKAEIKQLEETNERFKDYCAYKDLKALHKMVVPVVK